jgi:hypothetical protein
MLMPFVDLPFRLKPVGQIASVFVTSLPPKFVRALRNLFLKAYALVHLENWRGSSVMCFAFHSVNSC